MVPLLTDRGIGTNTATSVLSRRGTRARSGAIARGLSARPDLCAVPWPSPSFLAPLAGILLLFFGSGPSAAAIATVLVGAGVRRGSGAWLPSSCRATSACARLARSMDICSPSSCWVQAPDPFAMGGSYDVERLVSIDAGFFRGRVTPGERSHDWSGILCVSVGISALSGWIRVLGSSITCRAVEGQRSRERAIVKEELVWVFGTISATGSSPRRFDCNSVREPNRGRRPRQSLVHTDELPPFGRSPHDKCRRPNARHRAPEHRAGPISPPRRRELAPTPESRPDDGRN